MVQAASKAQSHQLSPKSSNSPSNNMLSNKELANQEASADEEDEDDCADEQRLEEVKKMLFDTYRIQNRVGLHAEDFICDLEFVFRSCRKDGSDERTLYHTWLKMPQD